MAVPVTLTEYAPDVPTVIDVVPGMLKEELFEPTDRVSVAVASARAGVAKDDNITTVQGEVVGAQQQGDGENSIERDIERGAAAGRL
jgi:hypothetical protein